MATFTVTTTADGGPGSLRQAVLDANATPGVDRIDFALPQGSVLRLVQGEIRIAEAVEIDGDLDDDGTPDITVTADALGNDRLDRDGLTDAVASLEAGLLDDNTRIFSSAPDTVITGLVLTGGRHVGTTPQATGGGAISAGDFDLTGGVSLTLRNSLLVGNSTGGTNTAGGAVSAFFDDMLAVNTTFRGNLTNGEGGAISASGVTLVASTVEENVALAQGLNGGGGIRASSVTLIGSTVRANTTEGQGGGIHSSYTQAYSSTIADNRSSGQGGGVFAGGSITLSNATVTGNATTGSRGPGGGTYSFYRTTIANSIVLGNVAVGSYGAVDEAVTDGSPLTIASSIVGRDAAAFDASAFPGVTNANPLTVFAQVSEVRAEVDADFDGVPELVSTGVFSGVLADNGGPVATALLRPDAANPAIDRGDDAAVDPATPTDARGLPRIADRPGIGNDGPPGSGIVDLGALEFAGEAQPPGRVIDPVDAAEAELLAFVYEALLNRDGAIDFAGFNFWLDALEGRNPGQTVPISLREMVDFFFASPEFLESFGDISGFTSREVVELYYRNVLDREGDAAGIDFWTGVLEDTALDQGDVLIEFALAPENMEALDIRVENNGDGTWDVMIL